MKEQDKQHNQDLQTLIERYSLNAESYKPLVIDATNGNVRNMKNKGPREGKIYGELTKYGLVHVWSDPDKSQYANAEVLIINHSFVATWAHNYNRVTGQYDWSDTAGITYSVPLVRDNDPIQLEPLQSWTSGRSDEDRARLVKTYHRVSRALASFANLGSQYDALHQTDAIRNPEVHDNMAQLYPYAGHFVGPRINVGEMMRVGVPFHGGVEEAMSITSTMMANEQQSE
jgi:hypothetical protein